MKKIVDVEVKDSKIIFKIEDKFLFNKKEGYLLIISY